MNKLKLLSSLTTIVATTSLVATSCAVVNKNSNNDTIANGIDVATIPWITRTKYDYKSDTTIKTDIVSTVYNDNVSIFARYPGLEDEISITATVNSGQVTIDVIVTTPIIYEGNTSWTATYDYEPLPIDGELNINTSTINDTMYVNTTAYDKKCEIFASTKVNNVITAVNISKVDVTLSGSGITTATGSVENNQGYVNLTIGTTAGVARLIMKVIDSKNNVGSVELIITVKKK